MAEEFEPYFVQAVQCTKISAEGRETPVVGELWQISWTRQQLRFPSLVLEAGARISIPVTEG